MTLLEVNYDGLVGPTHNYAGLAHGNLASLAHTGQASNPRAAALQGLEKMGLLLKLGLQQGVFPPQERPALGALRALGFSGSDAHVLATAGRVAPGLLAACYSSSSMWAANAACVAPSCDTADGRVHFTPANLVSAFHRSLEPEHTARMLGRLFPSAQGFVHHAPLPAHLRFGDEGAANHTRLWSEAHPGLHLFTYGAGEGLAHQPERYRARQTRQASEAVARLHQLAASQLCFVQQAPVAIDAGVFHNDVIAVGHGRHFFYHEHAYVDVNIPSLLRQRMGDRCVVHCVPERRISLQRAVRSYLFNSQLVLRAGELLWLAPRECEEDPVVRAYLAELSAEPAVAAQVHYLEVRESMKNGGGPACLRLRVPLTAAEWRAAHQPAQLTTERLQVLKDWVQRHYRDRLQPSDLLDPQLLDEARCALDELTQIMALGSDFYPFQQS